MKTNQNNNIKNLDINQLLELRELILFFLDNREEIQIEMYNNRKLKIIKRNKNLDYICLMMVPAKYPELPNNKNNIKGEKNEGDQSKFSDYIVKVVIIPHYIIKELYSNNVKKLITHYLNDDINLIFKIDHNIDPIGTKFKYELESKKPIYINMNYYKFIEYIELISGKFELNGIDLNKTIFLFEDTTWECLKIIFKHSLIRIHGGSHSKRHLISQLDYRLLDFVISFCKFAEDMEDQIFIDDLDNNRKKSRIYDINSRNRIEKILNYSYIKSETNKVPQNQLYSNLYNKYTKYLKLCYNLKGKYHNIAELTFLKIFYVRIYQEGIISLIMNGYQIKIFENQLSLINELIELKSKENNNINNNLKIKSINKKQFTYLNKSIKCINTNLDKKFIHTMNDSDSKNQISIIQYMEKGLTEKKLNLDRNIYLNSIGEIINNNNGYEAQYKIETLWNEIIKEKHNDINYLTKRYSNSFITRVLKVKETLDILEKRKILHKKFPKIQEYLNNINLLLLTYGIITYGINSKLNATNLYELIGKKIIFYIYLYNIKSSEKYNNYIKENKSKNIFTYLEENDQEYEKYIEYINFSNIDYIKLGDFYCELFIQYPVSLFERTFEEGDDYSAKIVMNKSNFDIFIENPIFDSASLPMLIPPIEWSDTNYGGYLLNKILKKDIITGNRIHNHQMDNQNIIFNAVNKMSKIPFRYNINLLKFLDSSDGQKLLQINLDKATYSEKLQIYLNITIAKIYSNVDIYMPLQIDWRSRIYVQSFYGNYQGSDLSLALLEFSKGESLKTIHDNSVGLNSLYIYGANLYNENNINKKTFNERINWVVLNKNKILNMDINFLEKAENKYCFAAFCLVMKELELDPNYVVKLPVFLDATCSGIQHLAALIKDCQIAKKVNLKDSKFNSNNEAIPEDFYGGLVEPINEEIRRVGKNDDRYPELQYVKLTRKEIKRPVMTRTYNVSPYGITNQLKSSFTKKDNFYIVPSIHGEDKPVLLTVFELFKIANIIYNSIFDENPGLNLIYNYFIEMTKVLCKVGIPITWYTPLGLKITQDYKLLRKWRLNMSMGSTTKKLVLKDITEKSDTRKQVSSAIPNIIHSLDATHVAKTILNDNYNFDIISIHDCFGTHPNNMHILLNILKIEFINIYSSESFLEKFHKRNLDSLIDYGFMVDFDENKNQNFIIYKSRSKLYIPNPPKGGTFDLNNILNSTYMFN